MNSDNQTHKRQSWQEVVVVAVVAAARPAALSVGALDRSKALAKGVREVMTPDLVLLLNGQVDNSLKAPG